MARGKRFKKKGGVSTAVRRIQAKLKKKRFNQLVRHQAEKVVLRNIIKKWHVDYCTGTQWDFGIEEFSDFQHLTKTPVMTTFPRIQAMPKTEEDDLLIDPLTNTAILPNQYYKGQNTAPFNLGWYRDHGDIRISSMRIRIRISPTMQRAHQQVRLYLYRSKLAMTQADADRLHVPYSCGIGRRATEYKKFLQNFKLEKSWNLVWNANPAQAQLLFSQQSATPDAADKYTTVYTYHYNMPDKYVSYNLNFSTPLKFQYTGPLENDWAGTRYTLVAASDFEPDAGAAVTNFPMMVGAIKTYFTDVD